MPALESKTLPDGETVFVFSMGKSCAIWADRRMRIDIETEGPARVTNLMNEPLAEAVPTARVTVGPHDIVFINNRLAKARKGTTR